MWKVAPENKKIIFGLPDFQLPGKRSPISNLVAVAIALLAKLSILIAQPLPTKRSPISNLLAVAIVPFAKPSILAEKSTLKWVYSLYAIGSWMYHNSGNNFPGIASQFAMHFCMTAIQNIFCVAVFFHRSVQNFIWNIYPSAEIANQIWGGKLFPVKFNLVLKCFWQRGQKRRHWRELVFFICPSPTNACQKTNPSHKMNFDLNARPIL